MGACDHMQQQAEIHRAACEKAWSPRPQLPQTIPCHKTAMPGGVPNAMIALVYFYQWM